MGEKRKMHRYGIGIKLRDKGWWRSQILSSGKEEGKRPRGLASGAKKDLQTLIIHSLDYSL